MAAKSRSQFATANQLSVFPETIDGDLTDILEKEFVDERNGYAHTPRVADPGALEAPGRANQFLQAVLASQELTGNLL